ncbi:MAG: dockerin type I repeat-containing protein, partial [Phycisphaerales bacterium]|nr:dockerin type I repeat-containing protein [Phycisphaerales bacterium]
GGALAVGALAGVVLESSLVFDNVALVAGGGAYIASGGDLAVVATTICGNAPDQVVGERSVDAASCVTDECIDADENGIPDGCEGVPCPGDIDGDGEVNGADLSLVLGEWSTSNPTSDINGDGTVDGADLALILGEWGPCPE